MYLTYANVTIFSMFSVITWTRTLRTMAQSPESMSHAISNLRQGYHLSHLKATKTPIVLVIMPCYREPENILMDSIQAVLAADYPQHCIRFMISFDGLEHRSAFKFVVETLGATCIDTGVPTAIAVIHNIQITISLFEHGGKRHCQAKSLDMLYSRFGDQFIEPEDMYLMLVDSDTRLAANALKTFSGYMVKRRKHYFLTLRLTM